ncbi:MAG: AbrB/MazE/SpoVT family DNA-binding domain-containing protein [Bilifractor sp.]|nr:AbrB/MazE/SpoVT family DNA-binding domain-containing protein [Lachnospiraceae bacterium]MDY2838607.1 AbrB/MazE/SpoVT family DNA-binding domain-containing protein [Bilifractor sp.]
MATMSTEFVNDAKVMSKGQVTIPKNVREALGIDVGDRVTFIVNGSDIRIMNSAVYALKHLQQQMKGQASKAGFTSEDDIAEWITMSRREDNAQ